MKLFKSRDIPIYVFAIFMWVVAYSDHPVKTILYETDSFFSIETEDNKIILVFIDCM